MTASWRDEVAAALGARVVAATAVAGGNINDAWRAELADGRAIFVKSARGAASAPRDAFAAEADGLHWLGEATARGGARVAGVLAVGQSWLALAWLPPAERGDDFAEQLGRGLARTHAAGAPQFGYARDGYLAMLPQPAVAAADAIELWIEHRLRPRCREAAQRGAAPRLDAELDRLRARPDRFGPAEPPSRLHGDLWWGNVVSARGSSSAGEPVLVDPAVYGGPREIDLAMLALFGDLPDALIAAYDEVAPLADDWRARLPLWQLYPLAAHAVLFGGGYGARLASLLRSM